MVTTLTNTVCRVVHVVAQAVTLVTRRPALRRTVLWVLVVLAVRVWVGVWPAAVLGGLVATMALVAGLAALDRRPTTRRVPLAHPAPVTDDAPRELVGRLDGRHAEFARGLAGLAAWYLDECEREAGR